MRIRSGLAVAFLAVAVPVTARDGATDRLFLKFGGMRSGSGIAAGLEYRDSHFGNGMVDLRLEGKASIRRYQLYELELLFPHVLDPRVFIEVLARYRSHTQIDYFGVGPDSAVENHSNFRIDGPASFGTLGFRPSRRLSLGGRIGFVSGAVGRGTDSRLSAIDDQFDPAELQGFVDSPDHGLVASFLALDYRDSRSDPRAGGVVEAQAVRYFNVGSEHYSFNELNLEAQHFIPVARRTTLAFRGRAVFTRPDAGHEIPFYLLPSLGGSDTLHAFENDRFRDRHTLVLNSELRYRATAAIGIELFIDAGQVASSVDAFRLSRLALSYGAGASYRLGTSVLAGVSIGLGREGARVAFRGNFRF